MQRKNNKLTVRKSFELVSREKSDREVSRRVYTLEGQIKQKRHVQMLQRAYKNEIGEECSYCKKENKSPVPFVAMDFNHLGEKRCGIAFLQQLMCCTTDDEITELCVAIEAVELFKGEWICANHHKLHTDKRIPSVFIDLYGKIIEYPIIVSASTCRKSVVSCIKMLKERTQMDKQMDITKMIQLMSISKLLESIRNRAL